MLHILLTQVHEVQSQSLPPSNLHTPHPVRNYTGAGTHTHNIHTATNSTMITQNRSHIRAREVSCGPHPADTSALSPESVTPSFKSASLRGSQESHARNTHSHQKTISTQQSPEQEQIQSLTSKSERGQLGTTPCRSQGTKTRVSHSLLQHCIHNIQT